jgi:hypothetical protein
MSVADTERQNSAVSELVRLNAAARARVPAQPTTPPFQTLPSGQVLNRAGKVIFTPTPREVRNK